MSQPDVRLRYVSVLSFADEWLDRLRTAVPEADVLQFPGATMSELPDDVRRSMTALHTSAELPDPRGTPALRWVQLDTSGVDHVVGSPLWQSSVPITTIGGVSPTPLAEYVLFTLLGFSHRLPAMLRVRDSRDWPSPAQRWDDFLPAPLSGATLGIVGYGRIGREIARMARVHGLNIIGVNRTGTVPGPDERARRFYLGDAAVAREDAAVEVVSAERLVDVAPRCDYLVVVCPLTHQTRGLVDDKVLHALRPGAVLINVARGGIVDERALLAELRSGRIAGAALDVFDDEPLSPDSPWWDEPRVFLTPHVAGLAPRYTDQVLDIVVTNLHRLAEGRELLNLVEREQGY
jgi:phosphoglycerate dehydrogenase-like enzyme